MKPGEYLIFMAVGFSFIMLGMLFWHFMSRRIARDKATHELQLRLLQTAGSAKELSELIRSQEGQSLLEVLRHSRKLPSEHDLRSSVIRAVRAGVLLLFLGLGMFVLAAYSHPNKAWIIGSALSLSAAVGLVASAASSVWLSRKLGRQE